MTDILIVVDDKEISSLLTDFLWAEGFVVSAADSVERPVLLFERPPILMCIDDVTDWLLFRIAPHRRQGAVHNQIGLKII